MKSQECIEIFDNDNIEGLASYVQSESYRVALGLPDELEEVYTFLARGEYNINYQFCHPITNQQLVLRVNIQSQMHLEHQIEYEFHALRLLESSGRTPKPIYVDGSKSELDYGILVMEYLEGEYLQYETELLYGAKTLADIHSIDITLQKHNLQNPPNPLKAILEECEEMIAVYYRSPLAKEEQKCMIRKMMNTGWEKVRNTQIETPYECCINTELNSTNFLVYNKSAYLVDWEKPLKGDPAQDLGHFLAPTTTFWKTDTILNRNQVEAFIDTYIQEVNGRFDTSEIRERVNLFIPINCLRGITWCAMAWVEYQDSSRLIRNESTWKKLNQYLEIEFLNHIYTSYLEEK